MVHRVIQSLKGRQFDEYILLHLKNSEVFGQGPGLYRDAVRLRLWLERAGTGKESNV